jgi:hypothetical protein
MAPHAAPRRTPRSERIGNDMRSRHLPLAPEGRAEGSRASLWAPQVPSEFAFSVHPWQA